MLTQIFYSKTLKTFFSRSKKKARLRIALYFQIKMLTNCQSFLCSNGQPTSQLPLTAMASIEWLKQYFFCCRKSLPWTSASRKYEYGRSCSFAAFCKQLYSEVKLSRRIEKRKFKQHYSVPVQTTKSLKLSLGFCISYSQASKLE